MFGQLNEEMGLLGGGERRVVVLLGDYLRAE